MKDFADIYHDEDPISDAKHHCHELIIADKTMHREKDTHEKMGYRDGLEAGKDVHLQKGFDSGFINSMKIYKELGDRIGKLMAMREIINSQHKPEDNEIDTFIKNLEAQCNVEATSNNTSNILNTPVMKDFDNIYHDEDPISDAKHHCHELIIADKTMHREKDTHEKMGYRDGLEAGKDVHLQKGFDSGFINSMKIYKELGDRIGKLMAMREIINSQHKPEDNEIDTFIKNLEAQCNVEATSNNTSSDIGGTLKFTQQLDNFIKSTDEFIAQKQNFYNLS
ncbi:hypothetical protein BB561_005235 [Smittium simulii]|uniref:Protein YAE1 n=1 Tax=Smittium simulii TaxID=133385 RepID=A0A2T9YBC9_9FUNG|nr:hypothetical protein BB561_005235 [Smittium simulii]